MSRFARAGCLCAVGLLTAMVSACGGNISAKTYNNLAQNLLASGKLRQDLAPVDAPYRAEDLVRSFQDIAFSYEFHFKNGRPVWEPIDKPLNRWEGQIRYRVDGDAYSPEDLADIAALTDRISAATGLSFVRSSGRHDMLITIATPDGRERISRDLRQRGLRAYQERYDTWRKTPGWVCGATLSGDPSNPGRLTYAHVFMGAEVTGIMRRSCLHEEITQALGLTNDSDRARPSIFNDDQEFALLTEHDAALLGMLYDARLEIGMTWEDAGPVARTIAHEYIRRRVSTASDS